MNIASTLPPKKKGAKGGMRTKNGERLQCVRNPGVNGIVSEQVTSRKETKGSCEESKSLRLQKKNKHNHSSITFNMHGRVIQ